MSLEEMKARIHSLGPGRSLARRATWTLWTEIYAPDYVWHRPPSPRPRGSGRRQGEHDVACAAPTPSCAFPTAETVAEGSTIAYRYTWAGNAPGQSSFLPSSRPPARR